MHIGRAAWQNGLRTKCVLPPYDAFMMARSGLLRAVFDSRLQIPYLDVPLRPPLPSVRTGKNCDCAGGASVRR